MTKNEKLVLSIIAKIGKEERAGDGRWVRSGWIMHELNETPMLPKRLYQILHSLESQGWIEFHDKRENRGKPYLCRIHPDRIGRLKKERSRDE